MKSLAMALGIRQLTRSMFFICMASASMMAYPEAGNYKIGIPSISFSKPPDWPSPVYISNEKKVRKWTCVFVPRSPAYLNICFKNSGADAPVYRISVDLFDKNGKKVKNLSRVLCDTGHKANNTSYVLDADISAHLVGLKPGVYLCKTMLDCDNEVEESDKQDNLYVFTISISASDVRNALDNATIKISPTGMRWRTKMKVLPSSSIPTELTEVEKKIEQLLQDYKKKTRRAKSQDVAKFLEDYAAGVSSSDVRFVAIKKAIKEHLRYKGIAEIRKTLENVIDRDGAKYALAIFKLERRNVEAVSHVDKKAAGLLAWMNDVKWAVDVLDELASSCANGKANSEAHDRAAQAYMVLGCEINAYAELVCANDKLSDIMKFSNGSPYNGKKKLGWLAPQPEMDVADFWWSYAIGRNNTVARFCRQKSKEWYEKAMDGVKHTSTGLRIIQWAQKAKSRISQIDDVDGKVVNKTRGPLNISRKVFASWGNREYKVGNVCFPMFRGFSVEPVPVVDAVSVLRSTKINGIENSHEEKWYRPSDYWLKQTCPDVFERKYPTCRILIIPMLKMPMKDEDFDDSYQKCPMESNLSTAFKNSENITDELSEEWISRYYNCQKTDLTLRELDLTGSFYKYKASVVRLKGERHIGLFLICDNKKFFVDFQIGENEIIDEDVAIRFAKRIRIK